MRVGAACQLRVFVNPEIALPFAASTHRWADDTKNFIPVHAIVYAGEYMKLLVSEVEMTINERQVDADKLSSKEHIQILEYLRARMGAPKE